MEFLQSLVGVDIPSYAIATDIKLFSHSGSESVISPCVRNFSVRATRGAFHSTKIFEISGLKSNGTGKVPV